MKRSIVVLLLSTLFVWSVTQAADQTVVMNPGESIELICDEMTANIYAGGMVITCNDLAAPTNTPLPTATNTPLPTATNTPLPTATNTPLPTATNTPLPTATNTPLPTATNTPLPTATNTPLPTATNTPLPTATNTPLPTATAAAGNERGRVQIDSENNLVADNGWPLRGEHIVISDYDGSDDYSINDVYNDALWDTMRDDYHLNTIRLMLSRPPQNWDGTIGANCTPVTYRCYPFDFVFFNGKTTLQIMDDAVDKAGEMGMYIVIDYHPVGGHIMSDFYSWWNVIAPRYANRTHVIYEAANEPVAWQATDYTSQDIADVSAMYSHIRNLAPDTHIILWSFPQGDDIYNPVVSQGTGIDYSNASVGIHPYGYTRSRVVALREQYPMILSEVGLNRDLATINHEQIGASWIWLDGIWNHTAAEIVTWPADPNAYDR